MGRPWTSPAMRAARTGKCIGTRASRRSPAAPRPRRASAGSRRYSSTGEPCRSSVGDDRAGRCRDVTNAGRSRKRDRSAPQAGSGVPRCKTPRILRGQIRQKAGAAGESAETGWVAPIPSSYLLIKIQGMELTQTAIVARRLGLESRCGTVDGKVMLSPAAST